MNEVYHQPSTFAILVDALRGKSEAELKNLYFQFFGHTSEDEPSFKKKVTFTALSIDTRGYKFNRDEANER